MVSSITPGDVAALVAAWWFHYDEWNAESLRALMCDDLAFSCASDTGTTDYEDFIRVDLRGADAVMAWKDDHRNNSPYPLRHFGTNVFLTESDHESASFTSYLFVTKIVDGRPHNVSSGVVRGTVRSVEGALAFSSVQVVLDTQESVRFADHMGAAQATP
ncbi:nuclear transport factor 2 family protein [Rhodococcus aetherivorans]